jgi:hypothetical protein
MFDNLHLVNQYKNIPSFEKLWENLYNIFPAKEKEMQNRFLWKLPLEIYFNFN